jgi:phenylpropionate dioxygenase-like ring-hydroxylating dioxygenase large terminal subunit
MADADRPFDVKRAQNPRRASPEGNPYPTPLEQAPWPDLGHTPVPAARYTSPEFMSQEWDKIWTKVWLLGGREADIPEPGDYICTEIGRESVLIVRQPDMSVKAFYNVCQHRGNRLRDPGLGNVKSFKCGYHHWEYELDGRFKRIPDLGTFPQGAPKCGGVPQLPCDAWGSFVWFSLNPDVEPLRDYLNVIPQHLDPYRFERMAMTRDLTIEWDCNWKASVDAFNESYHVQGTHPQLLWYLDDINIQFDCYDKHSRYLIPFGIVSPRVNVPPDIPPAIKIIMKGAGMDPADYDGRVQDIRRDVQKWKRDQGPAHGKDYSLLNDDQLTDDYNYLVFPNVTFNLHADDLMLFRQRPHATDPNKMYFDLWTFELLKDGEPHPERPEWAFYRHGEKSIGQVLDQDAFNLPRVQKGMQSAGFKGGLWLGDQEIRLRHFHKTIDDFIYGPGGKKPDDL